jgi:hypothetical protein
MKATNRPVRPPTLPNASAAPFAALVMAGPAAAVTRERPSEALAVYSEALAVYSDAVAEALLAALLAVSAAFVVVEVDSKRTMRRPSPRPARLDTRANDIVVLVGVGAREPKVVAWVGGRSERWAVRRGLVAAEMGADEIDRARTSLRISRSWAIETGLGFEKFWEARKISKSWPQNSGCDAANQGAQLEEELGHHAAGRKLSGCSQAAERLSPFNTLSTGTDPTRRPINTGRRQ